MKSDEISTRADEEEDSRVSEYVHNGGQGANVSFLS